MQTTKYKYNTNTDTFEGTLEVPTDVTFILAAW